jgi:uncharacterized membrane protein
MRRVKLVACWLLGLLFILAGVMHFVASAFFVRAMPPYLPWHLELVYLSGVIEVALGALVLIPRWRRAAAWGLIALLVAVFPANVHMALNPELFPALGPVLLWVRLPLQGVLIAWAYWFTRGPDHPRPGPHDRPAPKRSAGSTEGDGSAGACGGGTALPH